MFFCSTFFSIASFFSISPTLSLYLSIYLSILPYPVLQTALSDQLNFVQACSVAGSPCGWAGPLDKCHEALPVSFADFRPDRTDGKQKERVGAPSHVIWDLALSSSLRPGGNLSLAGHAFTCFHPAALHGTKVEDGFGFAVGTCRKRLPTDNKCYLLPTTYCLPPTHLPTSN